MNLTQEIEIFNKILMKKTNYSKDEPKIDKIATILFKGLLDKEKEAQIELKIIIPIKYLKELNQNLGLSDLQKKIEISLKKSKQSKLDKFEESTEESTEKPKKQKGKKEIDWEIPKEDEEMENEEE